jgi:hypothetical protein
MKVVISESQLRTIISEQVYPIGKSGDYKDPYLNYKQDATRNVKVLPKLSTLTPKQQEDYNKVVQTYNNTTLQQAVQWWKKWLNDPTTKSKFASNWVMNMTNVDSIFRQYNSLLDKIKLDYVWQGSNTAIAYVHENLIDFLLHVNVPKAIGHDALSVMIHEIQHMLFTIKPLHPKSKIQTDINLKYNEVKSSGGFIEYFKKLLYGDQKTNTLPADSSESPVIKQKVMIQKIFDLGFTREEYPNIVNWFNKTNTDDDVYLKEPTEIYSRLMGVRLLLNLKPEEQIKPQDFSKLLRYPKTKMDPNVTWLFGVILASPLSVNQILNTWNSYAFNNVTNPNSQNNTQV